MKLTEDQFLAIVILFFLALFYAPNKRHDKPISGDDKFESPVSECSEILF